MQASVEHDSRQTRQLSDFLTVHIQQAKPDGDLDFQAEAPIHWAFDAVRGCEDLLHRAIILARLAGANWGDIGREVAFSRQAAHARCRLRCIGLKLQFLPTHGFGDIAAPVPARMTTGLRWR